MVILDVIFIVLAVLLFISFMRSKLEFSEWLSEIGPITYTTKVLTITFFILRLLFLFD